ncbi:Cytochrome P450 71A26 [Zea mays]|uniref:Cytochrome P450 71A26 n=2 Tax=Zea mays TaxID=4577 RepID=A0A1D6MF61_MAIZE|nr:Cytochrome P450 71A26 [Zea mays]
MDVSAFLALLLIAPLSGLLLFLSTGRKTPYGGDEGRRLPPSPRGLPLLGHLPLLGPLPHRKLWAMAQAHGPVMLLRFGRVPTVVASSAAAAQEVMKTRDLAFASRPRVRMAERLLYGRDVAFVPYGEHWRQGRRVCVLHLLSQRRVSSFRHAREQEVAAMLARVRRGGAPAVNLTAHIISYTNGIISRAAFGGIGYYDGPDGGGEKLAKLFADFEGLLGTVTVGEFVPWLAWVDALMGLDAKAARTSAQMDAFLEQVIADHRRRRRGGHREGGDDHRDFVDVLLDVNEDEAHAGGATFDDVAIKAIILDMFAAATDTSYTTLVWAMAELINHPREMRKVQDEVRAAVGGGGRVTEDHLEELRYLRCVIKETLRLRTPLPLLVPRETTVDTELLGYHVPAGTRVIVNAWAIARDPATWERADEFVPERFAGDDLTADYLMPGQDFRSVPFGAGRRGCPGVGFSVPTMELALASLLYHFDWELPAGVAAKLEMDEVNGLSVRRKAPLYLVAKAWSPQ